MGIISTSLRKQTIKKKKDSMKRIKGYENRSIKEGTKVMIGNTPRKLWDISEEESTY